MHGWGRDSRFGRRCGRGASRLRGGWLTAAGAGGFACSDERCDGCASALVVVAPAAAGCGIRGLSATWAGHRLADRHPWPQPESLVWSGSGWVDDTFPHRPPGCFLCGRSLRFGYPAGPLIRMELHRHQAFSLALSDRCRVAGHRLAASAGDLTRSGSSDAEHLAEWLRRAVVLARDHRRHPSRRVRAWTRAIGHRVSRLGDSRWMSGHRSPLPKPKVAARSTTHSRPANRPRDVSSSRPVWVKPR